MKDIKTPEFPVEILPEYIQELIGMSDNLLGLNSDYMVAGYLSAISSIWGKRIQLRVKNNWYAKPTTWMAIVGNPSSKKSPALRTFFSIVQKTSNELHDEYLKNSEEYEKMTKEVKLVNKIPKTKHFVLGNYTTEALTKTHSQNNTGITVYADEIIGWVNGFGAYKPGKNSPDRQQHLEFFDGGSSNVTRMQASTSNSVKDAALTVIGGIQEDKLARFLGSEYKGDGFPQRILFIYPELSSDYDNELKDLDLYEESDFNFEEIISNDVSDDKFEMYNDRIKGIIKDKIGRPVPLTVEMNEYVASIREHYSKIINDLSKNPNINSFESQFLIKLDTYLPRLALLLELSSRSMNPEGILMGGLEDFISEDSMHDSFKLIKYYYMMNKKVNAIHHKNTEMDNVQNGKASMKDEVITFLRSEMYINGEITGKDIANKVGCSESLVTKTKKEIEGNKSKFE